ncbi:hypothetical protein ACN28I_12990 [Archangium gephyra]|uniref:hypothetical protein n=1 Tax=Archangium gephyra TaxID=48 RepID=UPI003B7C615E
MAREIASPKSSGGGGYNFEDEVSAWWMLNLLAGRCPLDTRAGPPTQLSFQARADGWLLDDLVANFAPRDGPVRAAISVKSGDVLKASRAPQDFVRDCWEQHLNPRETGFDASQDYLVLITSRLSKRHRDTVDDALQRALHESPERLDERLRKKSWCSQEVRTFIESFACPPDLPGAHPVHGKKAGALLKAVRFLEFDFTRVDAGSRADALRLCRELVESGGEEDSLGLWEALLAFVKDLRASAGELTLERLLDRLRGRVRLKHHPNHAPDWERMEKLTTRWLGDTQDTIGGLHLPRRSALQGLHDALKTHRALVILGDSGCGKSALLKGLMTARGLPGPTFCLPADEVARLDERAHTLAPSRPLEELVSTQPAAWALLALDGLERLSRPQDFESVSRLLRALRLREEGAPWRLLLLCQRAAWEGLRDELQARGVPLSPSFVISLDPFEEEELRTLRQRVPTLEPILARADLRPLTSNAKVLDLLARAVAEVRLPEGAEWKGESSLIRWYWERYLRAGGRGLQAARLVEKLAQTQADERQFVTPFPDLSGEETKLVPELVRLGVLSEREDTLRFTHDLHADYARQQYLLGQLRAQRIEEMLKRIGNPLWHRAVRLLGLHLLEQPARAGEHGLEEWRELLQQMETEEPTGSAGMDLLLEALVFTARPGPFLDEIFPPVLSEHEAVLLRRFLIRFFYTATVPHSHLLESAPKELRSVLTTRQRTPIPRLGLPTLEWLERRWKQLYTHAPDELILIATAWLVEDANLRPLEPRLLQPLSELVLSIAEWSHAQGDPPRAGENRMWTYALALLAGRTEPARATALIRKLSGRPADRESLAAQTASSSWPEGPQWPPDEDFRAAVLSHPGTAWLSSLDLNLALEVFLALLLEHPRSPRGSNWLHLARLPSQVDLLHPRRPDSPPYDLDPAWWLLNRYPEHGLKFVMALVDFATERWSEEVEVERDEEARSGLTLSTQGESSVYVGNQNVFSWHKDSSQPKVLAAALMALEAWLYEQLEQEQLPPDFLETLLHSSHSVAMIGVLMEMALRYPELLEGPLESLVEQPALYQWTFSRDSLAALTPLPWGDQPELRPIALKWRQFPHRPVDLLTAVTETFARREWQWPAVDRLLAKWKDFPTAQVAPLLRERLPAQLDSRNWRTQRAPDGTTHLEFVLPPEQRLREEQLTQQLQEQARGLFFNFPMTRTAYFHGVLNGTEPMTEEQIEGLLSSTSSLSRENGETTLLKRCGAAAIAIVRFPRYLREHPEWKQQCQKWLVEACSSLTSSVFDYETDFTDVFFDEWTNLCARGIVGLWSEEPDAPDLRRSMARLAGAQLNETVVQLFMGAAHHRTRVPEDFQRLLHLALWFSRLRVLAQARPITDAWKQEVDSVFARLRESFADKSLPPLPVDWTGLASAVPEGFTSPAAVPKPGFHINYLLAAWSWLYPEAQYQDLPDRAFLIGAVERLQQLMVSSLYWAPTGDLEQRPDGSWSFPHQGTYLPALSVIYTVHIADSATRRRLWEPWLRLPEYREEWTASFLESLYGEGLPKTGETPFFRATLTEILDFASVGQASAPLHRGKTLCLLLGCQDDEALQCYWHAKQESLATALRKQWSHWAGSAMAEPESATAFLSLLQTPAARRLRVESLLWLTRSTSASCIHRKPSPDTKQHDALISLLELIWSEHRPELERHSGARRTFDSLLSVLVGLQNGRAIVLSQQLGSARG